MGLLDEIGKEQAKSHPNRCPVAAILPEMSKDDLADLEIAMSDPGISHVVISRALGNVGVKVAAKGIGAHRKGECACAR